MSREIFENNISFIKSAEESISSFLLLVGMEHRDDESAQVCTDILAEVQQKLHSARRLVQRQDIGFAVSVIGPGGVFKLDRVHQLVVQFDDDSIYNGKFILQNAKQMDLQFVINIPFENSVQTIKFTLDNIVSTNKTFGMILPMSKFVWNRDDGRKIVKCFIVPDETCFELHYVYPIYSNNELRTSGFVQLNRIGDAQDTYTIDDMFFRMVDCNRNRKMRIVVTAVLEDNTIAGSILRLAKVDSDQTQDTDCSNDAIGEVRVIHLCLPFSDNKITRLVRRRKRRLCSIRYSNMSLLEAGLEKVKFVFSGKKIKKAFLFRDGLKEHLVAMPTFPVESVTTSDFIRICKDGSHFCIDTHSPSDQLPHVNKDDK